MTIFDQYVIIYKITLLYIKQQYDIQKSAGLAGIVGFLYILLVAVKWNDWFYPLFNKIGAVELANKLGLVANGIPTLAVIYIALFIFVCIVLIGLICCLLLALGILLLLFGQTNFGSLVLGTLLFVLFFPVVLPFFIKAKRQQKQEQKANLENGYIKPTTMKQAYSKDKALNGLLKKYQHEYENVKMFRLFEEQSIRENSKLELWYQPEMVGVENKNKTYAYLNRAVASIDTDKDWLIGFRKDNESEDINKFYVLLPNPLPAYASQYFLDDCYKEGSQLSSKDYHAAPKGEHLYNFLLSEFNRKYPSAATFDNYYVPAIEIEFVWDGYSVSPRVINGAEVMSVVLDHLNVYHIDSARMEVFFEDVSKKENVKQAIRETHIAMYLIPYAYPNNTDDKEWGYTGYYNDLVSKVPNADTFAPLYAADVKERIIAYANANKQWAINWIAQDV